jgi:hypothetical protein
MRKPPRLSRCGGGAVAGVTDAALHSIRIVGTPQAQFRRSDEGAQGKTTGACIIFSLNPAIAHERDAASCVPYKR